MTPTETFAIKDIILKCEWQNLTGTPKTRLVQHRLQRLEKEHLIHPGMTLYDVSTGSEAAALAQIGVLSGYHVKVWLPDYAEPKFVEYICRFGAEVNFVSGQIWLKDGAQKAEYYAKEDPAGFYFNQADAFEDALEAYGELGTEFAHQLAQLPDAQPPEAFVCVVGSGGLLLGASSGIKKVFPKTKIYAVELYAAPYLHSLIHGLRPTISSHKVWGIGAEESTRMKTALAESIDDVILIDETEMRRAVEDIPSKDGVSVDYPTASNIMAARSLVGQKESKIATIWTGLGWRTLL